MSAWIPTTCEQPSGVIDAVVWDFGNVLVRWDPARAVADRWPAEAFGELAVRCDFDAINRRLDRGHSYTTHLGEIAERDPESAEFWEHYVANIRRSLVPDVAGTLDLLSELHDAGVPQYGLTNWPAVIADDIPQIVPGAAHLRGIVVSGLEGVVKPEPAIYELLLQRFGLEPQATLFIDDRENNLAAAAEFGMRTFLFEDNAHELRATMLRLGLPVAAA